MIQSNLPTYVSRAYMRTNMSRVIGPLPTLGMKYFTACISEIFSTSLLQMPWSARTRHCSHETSICVPPVLLKHCWHFLCSRRKHLVRAWKASNYVRLTPNRNSCSISAHFHHIRIGTAPTPPSGRANPPFRFGLTWRELRSAYVIALWVTTPTSPPAVTVNDLFHC